MTNVSTAVFCCGTVGTEIGALQFLSTLNVTTVDKCVLFVNNLDEINCLFFYLLNRIRLSWRWQLKVCKTQFFCYPLFLFLWKYLNLTSRLVSSLKGGPYWNEIKLGITIKISLVHTDEEKNLLESTKEAT
jgi:hypothetical protein